MNDLILHHYDGSPFSEKLRLIFGFKNMAWRSVKVPVILPKPDVLALTGGYRKTPIAQRGADVYCDTALIARLIDQEQATPTLYPAGAPLAPLIAQWADSTLFWTVIPYTMQPAGAAHVFRGLPPEAIKAFASDRAPFTAGMKRQTVADATARLGHDLAALDAQLADGRPWLMGDAASIADFSVAHCAWYVRRGGPVAAIFGQHRYFSAWLARVLALGHGRPQAMRDDQALAESAAATQHAHCDVSAGLGFAAGQAVIVTPTDYGQDPVEGTLVGLSTDEVVLRRSDPRAGTVHVHFPRAGYQIKGEST
ncbi:MAG: glutathione S-transferase family protein [Rubrivivax sp.]|nr:glutathione S-transferase family protein [Rubrivivax sp.]